MTQNVCKACSGEAGEPAGSRCVPMIGRRYSRLVVEELVSKPGQPRKFRCVCDCGAVVEVFGDNVRRGLTRSCGCYARQRTGEIQRAARAALREKEASNAPAIY